MLNHAEIIDVTKLTAPGARGGADVISESGLDSPTSIATYVSPAEYEMASISRVAPTGRILSEGKGSGVLAVAA